ncbi:uncharacterized protein TrAtP1_006306 [Trichoderma atroviride]|uniref:uncharacterized protein n=1 Tax=Hypocrea atroviridis TaxID=63577 RepID=UPI003328D90D|nr:hypothetical protein TrAtP1_006306 [Trichoderma atroviride]
MASNTKTFVESYHINVGLGDSAIHVLATKGNGSQQPKIVAAVLVDGGLARDAAAQNISATIEDIESRYEIELLQFRSVVVTHWDADHWKGINKLLENEYPKHFDKNGRYNRFFHKKPVETTVYAPSLWAGSKPQKDTGEPVKKVKTEEQGITILKVDNGSCFSFRGVRQANAMVGSSIIGYDFFTNTKPSGNKTYSNLKKFKDVIGTNTSAVGMYCVASDLEVIGLEERPNRRGMDLEDSLFNQLPTETNQQSIAAIILWNNMHVSHYFAGDLDFWGETLLAEWLQENLKSNKAWEVLLVLFLLYTYHIPNSKTPCIATCYPYWLEDIHGLDGLEGNKINVDSLLPPKEMAKLPPTRRRHANRFNKLVETLSKSVPSGDNIFNIIRQSCLRGNISDNESIFEQIAIHFSERFGNLIHDLWRWDKLNGTIATEVVYIVLTLTDNIDNDRMQYKRKDKPYDKKDQIDQVVFEEVADGYGEEEPSINTEKSTKKTKVFQKCHVFVDGCNKPTEMIRNTETQNKIKEHVEGTSTLGKRSLWSSKPLDESAEQDSPHQIFMQSLQVPLLGAPVAVQANNSSQSTQYAYSILSSSYASSAAARAEFLDYTVLEVDDWLDDFLLSMNPSIIRLDSSLNSSLDKGWALLHENDYLGKWIRTGLGGSQMAVNGDGPEFRIIMPNGLIFSTGEAAKALGTDAKMSSDGLSPWTRNGTMVFGLDRFKNTSSKMDPLELISSIVVDNLLGMRWTLDPATSEGRRNAIWVTPIASYRTILRLAFIPVKDSSQPPLCNFLNQFFPSANKEDNAVIDISDIQLIFRKACLTKEKKGQRTTLASTQFLTLSARIILLGPKSEDPAKPRAKVTPNISIELASTGALELTVKTTQSDDNFTDVVSGWLSRLFPGCDTTFDTLIEQKISQNIWFRRLTIALNPDKSISRASVALEVNARLGNGLKPDQNLPIIFKAEYTNAPGAQSDWSISGDLWLETNTNIPLPLFSEYEEYRSLLPLTPDPVQALELTTLFASMSDADNIPDLPKGIPNAITAAGFRINKESIFVSGTISDCRHVLEGSNAPPLRLQELSVEARWNWKQKAVQVDLYFWLSLNLPSWYDAPEGCAANSLTGSVSYKSGGQWNVSAEVRDLNLGMLYGFFPESVKDTLFQLLKGIRIVDLGVYYYSLGAGQGTGLLCEGKLMLGDIMSLQLSYECDPDGGWKFHASLGPDDEIIEPITLGQIMSSFVDSSDASLCSSLPDFLANTVIIGGEDSNPKLEFTVENDKVVGPKMTVTASIMGFTVEFVQINSTSQVNNLEDRGEKSASGGKPGKILRLFKAVLTKIPMPQSIPILDHMDQPFDELGFFWINQTSETASATGKAQKPTPGMTGGFHFVIISKQKVVLDYPIGKQEKAEDTDDSLPEDGRVKVPGGDKTPSEPPKQDDGKDSQSSKASYKNTVGPLSISQIGFRYDGGTLAILMDAAIAFGPVALDLIGFTLGLHFKGADGSTKSLKSLSWHDVEVSISGVGVKFERPPLTISGAFFHEKTVESDMYAGGLTVGFTPWLFQAAGFYGVVGNVNDAHAFKCIFAYAMLHGPIMNIAGFAEISGLTGGFGYNIDLTLPTLDNIVSFPLLTPSAESVPPKELARTLVPGGDQRSPFFNPLNGAMFIAAGFTVTAFQMLEMTAVVAVQWSPRVQLALLGLAKCDVPSIKSPVKFAHIELGIIATVDLDAGILKVEAQLSPNSWIIHKNCHLTGGFAMYYWFGPGQTDWVMTIGGYHSAFVVPAHYPPTRPTTN